MTNTPVGIDISDESYVVEVDGTVKSKHKIFVEALQAGLKTKQQFPHGDIKVHEVNEHKASVAN
jgi:DMSO/TMAO reductase YedYZ molybdopterin-dependent catalytic subunit